MGSIKVFLLDAIRWTVKAWNAVRVNTIVKCFALVGFNGDDSSQVAAVSNDDENDDDDDNVRLAELVRELQYTRQQLEEMDSNLETENNGPEWKQDFVDSQQ